MACDRYPMESTVGKLVANELSVYVIGTAFMNGPEMANYPVKSRNLGWLYVIDVHYNYLS